MNDKYLDIPSKPDILQKNVDSHQNGKHPIRTTSIYIIKEAIENNGISEVESTTVGKDFSM